MEISTKLKKDKSVLDSDKLVREIKYTRGFTAYRILVTEHMLGILVPLILSNLRHVSLTNKYPDSKEYEATFDYTTQTFSRKEPSRIHDYTSAFMGNDELAKNCVLVNYDDQTDTVLYYEPSTEELTAYMKRVRKANTTKRVDPLKKVLSEIERLDSKYQLELLLGLK